MSHDWLGLVRTGQATGLFMTGCRTVTAVAVAGHADFGLATGPVVASYGQKVKKSSPDWTLEL